MQALHQDVVAPQSRQAEDLFHLQDCYWNTPNEEKKSS